jgi:hypothetical protein
MAVIASGLGTASSFCPFVKRIPSEKRALPDERGIRRGLAEKESWN